MNIKCNHCGQEYEVDESMTGANAECGVCAKNFIITPVIDEPEAVHQLTAQNSSKTVTVEPYWLGEIFTRRPIQIPASVNVQQFFEQSQLPPLFEDSGYASMYRDDKDRGFHWVAIFLSHPDENVALDVFNYWKENWRKYTESEVEMNYRTVTFICAAAKLLSNNLQVVKAAAEFIWRGYSEYNFGKLFRVPLSDLGEKRGYAAAKRLAELCPAEEQNEALPIFDELCREYFGKPAL
jgi:hypothetical protein